MDIRSKVGCVLQTEWGLGILGVFEDSTYPESFEGLFDREDFTGKFQQMLLVYPRGAVAPKRLLLVGLGARDKFTPTAMRNAMAAAIKRARAYKTSEVTVGVLGAMPIDSTLAAQALVEGLEYGAYSFTRYQTGLTEDERFTIDAATLLVEEENASAVAPGVAAGVSIAKAITHVRDLINTPPAELTPAALADAAVDIAERHGLRHTVLDRGALEQQGFGGILAVGGGSANEPRFIALEHGERREGRPTICLVGKGLTFDSGGLNIKPGDSMETMKQDMSGAAAVLGIAQAVAELELDLNVVYLISAAENMPSGTAYRPGDIVKTLSGKTVEVLNTDAEGRVALSDALFYAQRYEPTAIVSIATLTGAVIVALGSHATGLIATDQPLADAVRDAGESVGERVWQLPLWDEYRDMVKSSVADIKNIARGGAGTVTASAFLANFTGDYPFAHLDIAGTAWNDSAHKPHQAKGATGVGVRVIVEYLRALAS